MTHAAVGLPALQCAEVTTLGMRIHAAHGVTEQGEGTRVVPRALKCVSGR